MEGKSLKFLKKSSCADKICCAFKFFALAIIGVFPRDIHINRSFSKRHTYVIFLKERDISVVHN